MSNEKLNIVGILAIERERAQSTLLMLLLLCTKTDVLN